MHIFPPKLLSFLTLRQISLFLLLLLTIGCGTTKKKGPIAQEITVDIGAEPATLDPRKARLLRDFNLIRNFNEGLFRKNKEGKIVEGIAKSFSVSEDKKTYTIELKKTYWSNGDKVTSHDFIYAWRSLLNKDFPSPNASFLYYLKNAKAIKNGHMQPRELCAYADGDYRIIVQLEKPIPFFIELLSLPIYFPVNRYVDKQTPKWIHSAETYVCNGPFRPIKWQMRDSIVAIKNNHYWDKDVVRLQKITLVMLDETTAYNLFREGTLHHIGSPCSTIPTDVLDFHIQNGTMLSDLFLATYWIRTNIENKILANINFRKSLALAIDRKMISDNIFPGSITPATTIIPKSMGLTEKEYFMDADSKVARQLLETALQELGITKEEFPTLTLSYINAEINRKVTSIVQDQWRKELGIDVILEPLEFKVFADKLSKGKFELAFSGRIADYKDPVNFLELYKYKDIGTNNTGWENEEFISAIDSS
ncbi:peptide ABC transporter substrate-binding protein, partial [bacterium]|nr:peptide ABC transporter substrate-binding protein [bacterium]